MASGKLTKAELAATCGLLDPAHSQTLEIIEQVAAVIDRRPSYRTITLDPEIWREAGVLSGTLARTQGYGREQRRRVLNDALLFATARNVVANHVWTAAGVPVQSYAVLRLEINVL